VKSKPLKVILVASAVSIVGVLSWFFTFGNATWHIHRVLPGARVYFDPINSPDPSLSMLVRVLVPSYFGRTEDISIELSDHRTPIDFTPFAEFRLHSVHLRRCTVSDIRALISMGAFVTLDDCDLSTLPSDQRGLLWSPDPDAPNPERKLALNSP
jgi:hypothetical protein